MAVVWSLFGDLYDQADKYNREAILGLCQKGTRLLDLGCGNGEFTLKVADRLRAQQVCGIEIVPEIAHEARARGVDVYQSDLNRRLPFGNESFDVILANQVIEHLSDTDLFISEVHRVLRTNGYAIISTNNLGSIHCIFFLLLGMQPPPAYVSDRFIVGTWSPKRGIYNEGSMPQHRRIFTARALTELLSCYGFRVEKTVGVGFYPLPWGLQKIAARIAGRYAVYITVRARKQIDQPSPGSIGHRT